MYGRLSLKNTSTKSALVTGASRGIGQAIARRLARDGFDIAVHYHRDLAGAESTLADIHQIGQKARLLQFDVRDRERCKQIILDDIQTHGVYYGVVCNAGICRDQPFPLLSGDDWDQVIHTNLDGFYNVLSPIIMPMIQTKQGGRIVSIASIAGIAGNRGQVNYSASKAGIIGATKALALELAKRHIAVNCVAPGLIETDMTRSLDIDQIKPHIPMRRLGLPSEVAALVGFLFSEDASYITRQVISIDGGLA
jgi:3-oxoacyl-[acyl-carrier protein] reductase